MLESTQCRVLRDIQNLPLRTHRVIALGLIGERLQPSGEEDLHTAFV